MEILRKYNASATLYFPLVDFGASDFESTPVTFASGDTLISKDGGAFANTTNNPTHEGNGVYSLVLTATEMQAGFIQVVVVDQTNPKEWEDQFLSIQTYGNASAGMAFDLDTATQDVNVVQVSGDTTAADNLEADYDGTGYNKSNSTIGTCTTNTDMRGTDNAATASALATVDSNIDAILVDTGTTIPGILGTPADTDLATDIANLPTAIENADALLNRDMSAVSDTTARSPLNAFRILRNKTSITGSTLTVTKEDDSTSAWTASLTSDANANPVTGVDPA